MRGGSGHRAARLAACVAALGSVGLVGCASPGSSAGPGGVPSVRPPVPVGPVSGGDGGAPASAPAAAGGAGRAGTAPGAGGAAGSGGANGAGAGGPAGATSCPTGALSLAQLPGNNGAAGQVVVAIQLTNGSPEGCTLRGYPAFTLTAPSPTTGTDINEPVTLRHGSLGGLAFGDAPGTVLLAPGGHAGFLVRFGQVPYGDGGCVPATKLHLPLAGSAAVVGPVTIQVCGEPMLVSPFVAAGRLSIG